MAENKCPQCGAPIYPGAYECKYCGEKFAHPEVQQQWTAPQQTTEQKPQPQKPEKTIRSKEAQPVFTPGINLSWPEKSKVVAGLLAIFLGGFGIHKFYLGKVGKGILYLLFCWTWIPAILGFIQGITYLCTSDEKFQLKHHVRIV